MKFIKKMIQVTILTGILLMVQNVQAQRGQHHRGEQMLEKMKTVVDLTAEQETQITAIQEKYQPQLEALKAKEFEDRSEKKAAFGALMKAQKEEVHQVLTEEQKTTLKEQKREHHKRHRAEKKELHQEIKAYKAEHIHPVLLKQRAKLEQNISAEDKATLAELRIAFNQLKEEKQAQGKAFSKNKKESDSNTNRADKKAQKKTQKEALKEKYKAESDALKALKEKYQTEIESLFAEIEPQEEQWKKDIKQIHEKYAPKEGGDHEHALKRHHKGHGKRHHKGKIGHHKMGKKHFLLLDPNEAPALPSAANQAFTSLKTYPNPAINNNTLTYQVTKATRIKIALTDESGHVIKVLVNEFKEIGEYRMEVDLSSLKNGAYYYTVTDNGGITSKKVMVNSGQ